jgi:hypothetical protein
MVNAYQTNHPGDVFTNAGLLCKVNPTGTQLEYSTFFAGPFGDTAINAVALDSEGNAYVTGSTTGGTLPTTTGVVQPTAPFPSCPGGICDDAFVAKFSPAGSLIFSTYLAGTLDDTGEGIALDAEGNIYVVGSTVSPNFPILDPFQADIHGVTDVFLTKLNRDASRILFSSYLGGTRLTNSASSPGVLNEGHGIALDPSGNIYLTGYTSSSHFPTTPGVFQPEAAGGFCFLELVPCGDAFVAKLTPDGPVIRPAVSLDVSPPEVRPGGTVTATWAGIVAPTPGDEIVLLRLGDPADGPFVLGIYPTAGAGTGTMTIRLPLTVMPGTYDFRLLNVNPDHFSQLETIARSWPVTILDTVRAVASIDLENVLRVHAAGLGAGTYRVEAADSLDAVRWEIVVDSLTVNETGTAEFSQTIDLARPSRFYRISN